MLVEELVLDEELELVVVEEVVELDDVELLVLEDEEVVDDVVVDEVVELEVVQVNDGFENAKEISDIKKSPLLELYDQHLRSLL